MPPKRTSKKNYIPAPPIPVQKEPHWETLRDSNIEARFAPVIKKFVVPIKTINHRKYYDALRAYQIVAVDGVAGTLKTILACEAAAEAFLNGEVDRIVITRPMIPVGNTSRIGFLPGNLDEKCMVYLSHIIGMFKTLLPGVPLNDFLTEGAKLVFAPIDYLRGTTFDKQWVLADEMQNATSEELLMLINRLGMNSRLVINGDCNQIDIDNSGFVDALTLLDREQSDDFVVIEMTEADIVRNPLLREIARRWKKDYLDKTPKVNFTHSDERFEADFGDEDEPPSYHSKK